MLRREIKRFIVGLCCALVAGLLAVAIGEAGGPVQEGPVRTDCNECHESVVNHWAESAHGQATLDPVFVAAWEERGSPPECMSCHTSDYDPETGAWQADGINCVSCHSGQTGPHPETPMPTDPSSRLCGTCHVSTYAEWQISAHGEGEMTCVRCHNPHTTSLRMGNMQDLCVTCHNEESHFYGYTGHAQNGLQCTDCHLRVSESSLGEGHGKRVHTFSVDLATCTQCHGQEMHFPAPSDESMEHPMMWSAYAEASEAACEANEFNGAPVVAEPAQQTARPLNYLLVAAVGMGFGVAVTPHMEGLIRRVTSRDEE